MKNRITDKMIKNPASIACLVLYSKFGSNKIKQVVYADNAITFDVVIWKTNFASNPASLAYLIKFWNSTRFAPMKYIIGKIAKKRY